MFAEEEEREMVEMVVFNSRIKFDHPLYDDVDEYYLGLCNETEYEKEASNPREKEFGDSFKLLTIAERHQFLKTQTSRVFVPKKRRGSGGLGFTSMIKTQCTDQKAKSTTGSIDESGSPLGAILVPEKRRASRRKFVRKNNHCIMSTTDQEDHNLTAKMKSNQEKKTAGRKRVLKSQRVDVDDDRRQRSSKKMKKMGGRVDFKKLGLYPPPDLSSDIKSVMNHQEGRDSEIKLRIMKQMFKTDMDKHLQERFSMPLNQIKDGHDFLNETEMEEVRHGESMSTEVKLVELRLKDGNVHQIKYNEAEEAADEKQRFLRVNLQLESCCG
ncbi:DOMAIN PROTEIN putative (DUF313)-RELATED [Salix purpurea]|uniref:DOMAIN PROTEIN putative (DUF313)-RELATED n=1 Tax=Salix purpurea TaxID=77065 RepID=A0A9Q0WNL5_SALPP|nr:DOMAIN PROTEIN putative (DUF313)-RELATED [Salix purpurea]